MNSKKTSFYLVIKNFLTHEDMLIAPLLNQDGAALKIAAMELLINAPTDYKSTDTEVSIFIDKCGRDRDLPEKSYQIQHYENCSDKTFNAWAEDLTGTLNLANSSSIISLSLNDLAKTLYASKNNRFSFKSFVPSELNDLKQDHPEIFNTSNILVYISSETDITIKHYRKILESILTEINKNQTLGVSFFKYPRVKNIEVSILYESINKNAEKACNKGNNL